MSAAHKPSAPGRIARATASAVLIVLTCLLVPVTLITVWVHDIALHTGPVRVHSRPAGHRPGRPGLGPF